LVSSVCKPIPSVITMKPFSQQWHLSAIVMTVVSGILHFIPGYPDMFSRTASSGHLGNVPCYNLTNFGIKVKEEWDNYLYLKFAHKIQSLQKKQPQLVESAMNRFWQRLFDVGGALFVSRECVYSTWWVGHLSFVSALAIPKKPSPDDTPLEKHLLENPTDFSQRNSSRDEFYDYERYFLISDPEILYYKLMTFSQMLDLISNPKNSFDLDDVCPSSIPKY